MTEREEEKRDLQRKWKRKIQKHILCVCVCVCLREREKEKQRGEERKRVNESKRGIERDRHSSSVCECLYCMCFCVSLSFCVFLCFLEFLLLSVLICCCLLLSVVVCVSVYLCERGRGRKIRGKKVRKREHRERIEWFVAKIDNPLTCFSDQKTYMYCIKRIWPFYVFLTMTKIENRYFYMFE